MSGTKPLKFAIVDVRTEQFATFGAEVPPDQPMQVDAGIQFRAAPNDPAVAVVLTIQFLQDEQPRIKLDVLCAFAIEREDFERCRNDQQVVYPRDFMIHLVMLTIGTARGILHARLEQTPYARTILPPLDARKMVAEDVVFDLPASDA